MWVLVSEYRAEHTGLICPWLIFSLMRWRSKMIEVPKQTAGSISTQNPINFHILGLKWKHSDKRFIIKRIIIRKGASQIRCELSLTASIKSWKMTVRSASGRIKPSFLFFFLRDFMKTLWRKETVYEDTLAKNKENSLKFIKPFKENIHLWFGGWFSQKQVVRPSTLEY